MQTVGVFVDESKENVLKCLADGVIDIAQLHGKEPPSDIAWLKEHTKKPIMKAFCMGNKQEDADDDKLLACIRQTKADYILFDSGRGSGMTFNWKKLQELRKQIDKPFFLAGGISEENVQQALRFMQYR